MTDKNAIMIPNGIQTRVTINGQDGALFSLIKFKYLSSVERVFILDAQGFRPIRMFIYVRVDIPTMKMTDASTNIPINCTAIYSPSYGLAHLVLKNIPV
jgi:hypothetical protein